MSFETPTTDLEAVNAILASVGESPINALGSGFVDSEMAYQLLQKETKLLLTKGWHFNEETDVSMTPTVAGTIVIPTNTLRFTCPAFPHYVQRGGLVYDRVKHSSTSFTEAITATLIVMLPFADIPEAARLFLTIKAGRIFQDQYQGDANSHAFSLQDEQRAFADFLNDEAEAGQYNMMKCNSLIRRTRRYR